MLVTGGVPGYCGAAAQRLIDGGAKSGSNTAARVMKKL